MSIFYTEQNIQNWLQEKGVNCDNLALELNKLTDIWRTNVDNSNQIRLVYTHKSNIGCANLPKKGFWFFKIARFPKHFT